MTPFPLAIFAGLAVSAVIASADALGSQTQAAQPAIAPQQIGLTASQPDPGQIAAEFAPGEPGHAYVAPDERQPWEFPIPSPTPRPVAPVEAGSNSERQVARTTPQTAVAPASAAKAQPVTKPTAKPTTAICRDGTSSTSVVHQGACSHHGGVREWK
jgi:membrane-associated protease RseP (regulator of RpoE activity)